MNALLKNKIIVNIITLTLTSMSSFAVFAYELPPPEKRQPNAIDLSIHNAMFLRNGTKASVIGVLKKQGKNYVLVDEAKGGMDLPIAVHPSIQIEDGLLSEKVRLTGRMTYQTMYFPDMPAADGPAYSFKFELYSIEKIQ